MSKIITTHLTVSAPVEHVWKTLTDLATYHVTSRCRASSTVDTASRSPR